MEFQIFGSKLQHFHVHLDVTGCSNNKNRSDSRRTHLAMSSIIHKPQHSILLSGFHSMYCVRMLIQ